jgi:hypothetical protein
MVERTLVWDKFAYLFEAERKRREKPVKTYRNPIFLAREWAEAMKQGNFQSQSAFARAIGVSPARVSQVLRLLKLPESVRTEILQGRIRPTERGLRGLLAGKTTLPHP